MSFAAKNHSSLTSKRMDALTVSYRLHEALICARARSLMLMTSFARSQRPALFHTLDSSRWDSIRFDAFLAAVRLATLQAVTHISVAYSLDSETQARAEAAEQKGIRSRTLVLSAQPKSLTLRLDLPHHPDHGGTLTHSCPANQAVLRYCSETLHIADPKTAIHIHLQFPFLKRRDSAACAAALNQLEGALNRRQGLRWSVTGEWAMEEAADSAAFAQAAKMIAHTRPDALHFDTHRRSCEQKLLYLFTDNAASNEQASSYVTSLRASKPESSTYSTISELRLSIFLEWHSEALRSYFPSLRSLSIVTDDGNALEYIEAPALQRLSLNLDGCRGILLPSRIFTAYPCLAYLELQYSVESDDELTRLASACSLHRCRLELDASQGYDDLPNMLRCLEALPEHFSKILLICEFAHWDEREHAALQALSGLPFTKLIYLEFHFSHWSEDGEAADRDAIDCERMLGTTYSRNALSLLQKNHFPELKTLRLITVVESYAYAMDLAVYIKYADLPRLEEIELDLRLPDDSEDEEIQADSYEACAIR